MFFYFRWIVDNAVHAAIPNFSTLANMVLFEYLSNVPVNIKFIMADLLLDWAKFVNWTKHKRTFLRFEINFVNFFV